MDELEKKIEQEADLGLELCQKGEFDEGIKHLKFAAERNHLNAMVNLGHALKLIDQYDEAFKWTLRAAELNSPTAISNLAIMYRRGQGTDCNVDEAVKWGKKLIELGRIDEGYQEIVCSYLYAVSEYQRDFNKAFEYALEGSKKIMSKNPKPSRGDDCETVVQLALCYDFGKGVEADKKEALKYYMYCAECGLGIACYNAACILAYNEDKEITDIKKAISLFKRATQVDYGDAWYQLGCLYENGDKVEKDIGRAKFFYAKAIRLGNGDEHYDDSIESLKRLSPDDIETILSGKYSTLID